MWRNSFGAAIDHGLQQENCQPRASNISQLRGAITFLAGAFCCHGLGLAMLRGPGCPPKHVLVSESPETVLDVRLRQPCKSRVTTIRLDAYSRAASVSALARHVAVYKEVPFNPEMSRQPWSMALNPH